MAHNLDTNTEVGGAAFFSVRLPAWHSLGNIIQHAPSKEEAMTLAGHNFRVEKRPVYDEDMRKIENYNRTIRLDRPELTLGVVTDAWEPIQNEEAYDVAEAMLGTNEVVLETGGTIDEGRRIFLTAKLDKTLYIGGEALAPYFLITLGHNGRHALKALCTPTRVVCQNTLQMAVDGARDSYSFRHTKGYDACIGEAKNALGLVKKYYETYEERANRLLAEAFSKVQFTSLVETLVPIAEDAVARTKTLAEQKRADIIACYGADDLNDIRETKWGAFNAIADFSDHHRTIKNEEAEPLKAAERRFLRTFEDTGLKTAALALLTR